MDTSRRGRVVETAVAGWLAAHGYRVIERNFRCKSGEIDLVAEEDGTLCFVEVRSRADAQHASPLETIDARKRAHIIAAARCFLLAHPELEERRVRFDVVGVTLAPPPPELVLVRGAFEAEEGGG